eukprot:CAMPEP_0202869224 /NCGR_PEP_ID=MMETSP1391-20130828/12191_1 /ASSEMBLY_ACC=CAM_ASM_000867 /TAXON_ID=1034604 /ORGANISM="Chlamydomonas leiostraca, Strain SAG 11-49" /LENGTH=34 /DNA_ID= /DNA_START= /DNA_END= /DNA_ORIENTATION=
MTDLLPVPDQSLDVVTTQVVVPASQDGTNSPYNQ